MDSCHCFCDICDEIHIFSIAVADGQLSNLLLIGSIIRINPQFYASACRAAVKSLDTGCFCRKYSGSLSTKIHIRYFDAVPIVNIADMDAPLLAFHMAFRLNSLFNAFVPFYRCLCDGFRFVPDIRIQRFNGIYSLTCACYQRNRAIRTISKFFYSHRARKSTASRKMRSVVEEI